ncbi:site-2 protease family protein [Amycolatopsis anabasis]|uniref:site-2 protease family protein n=1 Tax=Amycolatopsis anabasis TaxID=1840409 RepID=UPI00131B23F2|nr:site-2 protease family protein [Amycolatopsis anabasis]
MFRNTVPLGRFGGIPVGAHWSVVVVVVLIAQVLAVTVLPGTVPDTSRVWHWFTATVTALCFVASLLAHELAHAVTARRHGVRVKRITLWMLGGAAELEDEPATPKADFAIAVAGPAASALIGGACWGLAVLLGGLLPAVASAGLVWLGFTNGLLAAFNLLPGAPLDGGRILRAALWKRTGDRARAAATATRTGQALGGGLIAFGLAQALLLGQLSGLWTAVVGWFLIAAAQLELAGNTLRERLGDVPVRSVMALDPVIAPGWMTVQAFLDRIAVFARHRVFPVLAFEGAPLGVVSLEDLTRMSIQDRMTTRVAEVCRRVPEIVTARSDDRLVDVVTKSAPRAGKDLILVVDDDTLVGVIAAGDVARVLELAALGCHVPDPAN